MALVVLMFLVGAGIVVGGSAAVSGLPAMIERRRLDKRVRDLATPLELPGEPSSLVMRPTEGPVPAVDRFIARTSGGRRLARLIEQSGVKTSPSAIVLASMTLATVVGMFVAAFSKFIVGAAAALLVAVAPIAFLLHRRSKRTHAFEEMFPEALDLMSRALRAGHAFQTSLGMAAEEIKEPVGPEFKKTFDQQNFGLPLRDALTQLSERMPLLDVRFFVTAVLIQRETGGNLAEILENLAHVVRERFKIRRQVRVYTAHGRFTAFVLLSLPAALAIALMFLNPDHMQLLFKERMGQTMLVGAMIMQAVGFVWIRQVIKIEV
jgi:tight adherence protein B